VNFKDESHRPFLDSLQKREAERDQAQIIERLDSIVELLTALHKELYRFRTGE